MRDTAPGEAASRRRAPSKSPPPGAPPGAPLISIIVPTLNEQTTMQSLLDHLAGLRGAFEVIIADGGSSDRTRAIAAAHRCAARLIDAPRGRACQMNAGASIARGTALLFLHADTRLPADAYEALRGALADAAVIGGNFTLRFDGGDRFSRLLSGWYAIQRRAGVYYGDSAIWLRRQAFEQLHGYEPLPIMEDYDLARRMRRTGATACLASPARTSARRWQQLGLPRTIASWVLIRWLYLAGVPPMRLVRLYPHARAASPTG